MTRSILMSLFLATVCFLNVFAQTAEAVNDWIALVKTTEGSQTIRRIYVLNSDGEVHMFSGIGSLQKFASLSNVKKLTSNTLDYALALKQDGTVWAWGNNEYGQLGNKDHVEPNGRLFKFSSSNLPVPVTGLSGVMAISAYGNTSYAVRNDETVWAWGHANLGMTGNGKEVLPARHHTEESLAIRPQKVVGITDAVAVSGPMALLADGTVWAWGENNYGQLGNGNTTSLSVPRRVPGLSNVVAISANVNGNRMALCADGTVWTWGTNLHGLLGRLHEDQRYSTTPGQAKGIQNAIAISSGRLTNLVLLKNGTVKGCGDGRLSALGLKGREETWFPVIVPGVKHAVGIQAAIYSGFALLQDGSLVGWGDHELLKERKPSTIADAGTVSAK